MSKGIMPDDSMLTAMNIDKETAQLYINAILSKRYTGGGSGGSGRRSGSSKSGGGSSDYDYSGTDTGTQAAGDTSGWGSISAYNNRVAKQVLMLASNGNLSGAEKWLNSKADYFSAMNAMSLHEIAKKKNDQYWAKHGKK